VRSIIFKSAAFQQFIAWEPADKKIFRRLANLMAETRKNPFKGRGKPQPLKGDLKGCWSRRITREHRLIYQVTDSAIIIIACQYHY